MPASRGISGKGLVLEIDGVEQQVDMTNVLLDNEEADSDTVTFAEVSETGARQWFFELTALQSMQSTGLWRYIWEHSGETVNFTFKPEGGATPTSDSPWLTGSVVIGPKPALGLEAANGRNVRATFDTRWEVVGEPVLDTTA